MSRRRVLVVGGGVSGLAAALDLVDAGADVTVLESRSLPGGLLHRADLDGVPLDVGVEAVLARRPEGVDLVRRLGLADLLVVPTTAKPAVWRRDGVRPLPPGTLMGVPGDRADLDAVLRPDEVAATRAAVARARAAGGTARTTADVSVAEAVRDQAGAAVLDVLVEPLLGGVHAGRTDELSLRSTVPALWQAWRRGEPFADVVTAAGAAATPGAPVFQGLRGGMALLVDRAVERLRASGATVRTGVLAHDLRREGAGWSVGVAPATGGAEGPGERVVADAVVVALPLHPARRLLAGVLPAVAAVLDDVPVVSVAVVALALRSPVPERSGLLVPPGEAAAAGVAAKAVTFSSRKWAWLAERSPGRELVRVSYGRRGEEAVLQRSDEDLVALARDDLATLLAVDGLDDPPEVAAAHVARWGGALPQHTVGHVGRVAEVRALVAGAGGLAVAGGWVDGVGVPACIGSGRAAAAAVTA